MTLNDTLVTPSFGGTYDIHELSFRKQVGRQNIAQLVVSFKILEFDHFVLGGSSRFLEVSAECLGNVLFFLVIETKLKSLIPINLCGSDLCYYTRTAFDDRARDVLPVLVKNAGHTDFFTN